jgi:hypothetical protein
LDKKSGAFVFNKLGVFKKLGNLTQRLQSEVRNLLGQIGVPFTGGARTLDQEIAALEQEFQRELAKLHDQQMDMHKQTQDFVRNQIKALADSQAQEQASVTKAPATTTIKRRQDSTANAAAAKQRVAKLVKAEPKTRKTSKQAADAKPKPAPPAANNVKNTTVNKKTEDKKTKSASEAKKTKKSPATNNAKGASAPSKPSAKKRTILEQEGEPINPETNPFEAGSLAEKSS